MPAVAPATPAPSGLASGTAAPAAEGTIKVHIQTKELVTLEHRSGPDASWQHGCQTPCDAQLPAADEYRVIGEGVNESQPFSLTVPKGDTVTIHVSPGLKSKEKTGEIMTITGAVVFVGAVVAGIAAADPSVINQANSTGVTNNYNWNVIAVGTTVALAGLVTGILGGAWWYDNSHTKVAGDVQGDQPVRGGLEPRYQTGLRQTIPNLPSYGTPVLSLSF
jgi:hypothetical protein